MHFRSKALERTILKICLVGVRTCFARRGSEACASMFERRKCTYLLNVDTVACGTED